MSGDLARAMQAMGEAARAATRDLREASSETKNIALESAAAAIRA